MRAAAESWMKTGQNIYIQHIDSDSLAPDPAAPRQLQRGLVVGATRTEFSVALEEGDTQPPVGAHVMVFFHVDHNFVQQPTQVAAVDASASACIIDLVTVADAVSAEQRESYRVTAIGSGATAELGSELDCRVQDVSATGFAIASVEEYQIGETLAVKLRYLGEEFAGEAMTQNHRKLWGHRIRYGLRCLDATDPSMTLRAGLVRISGELQREQLRRLRNESN
jgi:hypothetical protein